MCGVCLDEGWLKQPHLAQVRPSGLWGWLRLHSWCALRNQWLQANTIPTILFSLPKEYLVCPNT